MMVKVDLQSATLTNAKGTTRTLPIILLFSQDNSDFGGVTIPNDGNVVVVSTQVPAGNYAINAKAILVNQDDDDAGAAFKERKVKVAPVEVSLMARPLKDEEKLPYLCHFPRL